MDFIVNYTEFVLDNEQQSVDKAIFFAVGLYGNCCFLITCLRDHFEYLILLKIHLDAILSLTQFKFQLTLLTEVVVPYISQ